MTEKPTTITTSRSVHADLQRLTPKGATLGDTVARLIAEHEQRRTVNRLAYESRMAAARSNAQAVATADRLTKRLVAEAQTRAGHL
ncbi:hypothetical protein [Nocardia sp. NPDC050793]|uniref:hypothetical protein n=1 Tax=Nocardia sp. NPDC050793 TaxID=3155159 RepID=UPI0033FA1D51